MGSEAFRPHVEGGAFDNFETPFGFGASEGINRGKFESTWVVELEVPEAFEVSLHCLYSAPSPFIFKFPRRYLRIFCHFTPLVLLPGGLKRFKRSW